MSSHSSIRFIKNWYVYSEQFPLGVDTQQPIEQVEPASNQVAPVDDLADESTDSDTSSEPTVEPTTEPTVEPTTEQQFNPEIVVEYWADTPDEFSVSPKPQKRNEDDKYPSFKHQIRVKPQQFRKSNQLQHGYMCDLPNPKNKNKKLTVILSYNSSLQEKKKMVHSLEHVVRVLQPQ